MIPADEKPVELLNKLIGISNNRIEVFSFAAKHLESNLMKTLFERLVETSLFCRDTLTAEVYKLGGVPVEGTLSDSAFHKAWLCMHNALHNQYNKQIAEAALQMEEASMNAFRGLCNEYWMLLNSLQRAMLQEQMTMLAADLNCVSNLRNVFRTAA